MSIRFLQRNLVARHNQLLRVKSNGQPLERSQVPLSGHTNAPDDPRLPLRNLFSALRLSEFCVSAVSPSSLSSLVRRSFSEGGPLHPSAHQSLPWTHKRHRRRCPQRTPSILQFAGSSGEDCGEELLGLVERKGEAEEIGAASVGVFFVAGGFARGEGC